jgi:hypothetical protein
MSSAPTGTRGVEPGARIGDVVGVPSGRGKGAEGSVGGSAIPRSTTAQRVHVHQAGIGARDGHRPLGRHVGRARRHPVVRAADQAPPRRPHRLGLAQQVDAAAAPHEHVAVHLDARGRVDDGAHDCPRPCDSPVPLPPSRALLATVRAPS